MNFQRELDKLKEKLTASNALDENFSLYEKYIKGLDADDLCMCFESFLSCKNLFA